jgi:hypothetical protein
LDTLFHAQGAQVLSLHELMEREEPGWRCRRPFHVALPDGFASEKLARLALLLAVLPCSAGVACSGSSGAAAHGDASIDSASSPVPAPEAAYQDVPGLDGGSREGSTDDSSGGLDSADASDGADASTLDASPADAAPCGALGEGCCAADACSGSLHCSSDGTCASPLPTGQACSLNTDCSGGICMGLDMAAGCTDNSWCSAGSCCLTFNAGGPTGVCQPGRSCALQPCIPSVGVSEYPPCDPFVSIAGLLNMSATSFSEVDAAAPGLPDHVCTTACQGPSDCLAGWMCEPMAAQAGTVCQCSATYEICDGKDNDCNGVVDDQPGADRSCVARAGAGYVCQAGQCVLGTDGGDAGGGTDASGEASAGDDGGASSSSDADLPAITPATYDPSIYQHHKNGSRNGVYIDPSLTLRTATKMHLLGGIGNASVGVTAQPLYVENGPGGAETVVVATLDNHLTAFDIATNTVIWDQGSTAYGQPVAPAPCTGGGLNSVGIVGTPFLDPASPINGGEGVIYFDAMMTPDANATAKHRVFAVRLSDGTLLPGWPVDLDATIPGFISAFQNQRGALQLVNGVLYVPYGGFNGDCPATPPTYYGWVVGIPVANPQTPTAWHTSAYKGGIWSPGALATDGLSIFPVTGNTIDAGTWGGGEAVIRLAATPSGPTFSGATADYYAPSDWSDLDTADEDLGSTSVVLFDMPGAYRRHLVAAIGKDSNFYLLDRDNLGGIGGQLLEQAVATCPVRGVPAVYTTHLGTYVVFEGNEGDGILCCPPPYRATFNLIAVKILSDTSGFSAKLAWCSPDEALGSPIVTTTDGTSNAIVWDGWGRLAGYDGDTGEKLTTNTDSAMSAQVQAWGTPIAIGRGRVAIELSGMLYLYGAP